jgi:patatin-related protein
MTAAAPIGPPTSTPSPPTADSFHREIRFAVVMYGGVSLSIYMNGISQELLRMVRATAARDGDALSSDFRWREAELTGTEAVYRRLGGALKARFVVDLLSGTSAGGINALFLAKALTKDRSLDRLRNLWVSEGDIEKLLADAKGSDGLPRELLEDPPPSLLNGQRFYFELLEALAQMEDEKAHAPLPAPTKGVARPPYTDRLDLYVTATDFRGVAQPLMLFDSTIDEPVHRKLFHFRFSQDGLDEPDRDDFSETMNPMLAFAARCTASFPGAFAPFKLEDIDPILREHRRYRARATELGWASGRWRRFFEGYPAGYEKRYFVDGGYLDNKPFDAVVGALAERRNVPLQVERRLLYIEPDPESDRADVDGPRPDALAAVLAVDALPRVETIRAELDEIARRNRIFDRASLLTRAVETDARQRKAAAAPAPTEPSPAGAASYSGHQKRIEVNRWALQDLRELIVKHGLSYGGYHRLKVSRLTDWLTELLQGCWDAADPARPSPNDTRAMVSEWRSRFVLYFDDEKRLAFDELRAALDSSAPTLAQQGLRQPFAEAERDRQPYHPPHLPETENRLLADLDVAYRMRRLQFIRLKLRALLEGHGTATAVFSLGYVEPPAESEWQGARDELRELQRQFQVVDQRLVALSHGKLEAPPAPGAPPSTFKLACAALTAQGLDQGAVSAVLDLLRALVARQVFDQGRACVDILTATPTTSAYGRAAIQALRYLYDHYDDFDLVRFPMMYCLGTDELETVNVMRVSADDTTLAGPLGARKLAGAKLGHFGAFLDERWRENDILWGRLDGAERIIRTLAEGTLLSADEVDGLLLAAQRAIVEEERSAAALREAATRPTPAAPLAPAPPPASATAVPTTPQGLADYVLRYTANQPIVPERSLSMLSRSTAILGKLLGDLAERRKLEDSPVVSWGARLLRVAWSLVELATPKSIGQALLHHWATLIMLSGGLLLGLGVLFGWNEESRIGLFLGMAAFLAILLGQTLTRYASGRTSQVGTWLATGATIVGAGVTGGTIKHVRVPEHATFKMVDLQLARTAARLGELLRDCPTVCRHGLVEALGWDIALIAGYMLALGGLSWLVRALAARVGWRAGARVAGLAAALALAAGLSNGLENCGLLFSVGRTPWAASGWTNAALAFLVPRATFGFAALKWGLLFLVLLLDGFVLLFTPIAATRALRRKPKTRIFLGHDDDTLAAVWRPLGAWLDGQPNLTVESCDLRATGRAAQRVRAAALSRCRFALFVVTGNDPEVHHLFHWNVGLFQGRLGMEKTIVVREEGCRAFNEANAGQVLAFAAPNVAGVNDDIRRALDRQGIT